MPASIEALLRVSTRWAGTVVLGVDLSLGKEGFLRPPLDHLMFLLLGEVGLVMVGEVLEVMGTVFLCVGEMLATVSVVSSGRLASSSNLF